MKNTFLVLILVLPMRLMALELNVGDVLLQPLDCWSCSLIEAQENSEYSHMGIVIETNPEVKVAEALGKVRILPYEKFNSRTEKGKKLLVLRLQDKNAVNFLHNNVDTFNEHFKNNFEGLDYDHDFLWDNFDHENKQKLYCSEMVTKLLQSFLGVHVPTKAMNFDINRDFWIRYFNGNPPDSERGNSPATFENSELFYRVGEI